MLIASPLTLFMKREVIEELPDFIDKDIFEKISLVGSTLQMSMLLPKEDRRKILFDAGKFTKILLEERFDEVKTFELRSLSIEGQIKVEEIEQAILAEEKIGERYFTNVRDGNAIVEVFDSSMLLGD